jgi:Photosynthetic reaction centre cytochrome C subunit
MKTLILFAFVALLLFVAIGPASSKPIQESRFKNIKVLNDLSDPEIQKEMQNFAKSLGVTCTYCHQGTDYASDENPKKETARKMYTMVKTINKDFLGGKAACVLCHRGSAIPDVSQ